MTAEATYPPIIRLQADETTAFLRAARSGNLKRVVEFLDTNLNINTANSNGLNALHLASKDGHVPIVTELLRRGAKVDAATKKGNTALHIASLAGQAEVVNILIQYGAAVNIQSQNGFTPLYMAAQENHDEVVKLLLANGANQSLATEDGFTPLAVAMQQGHDKVVSVLLENDTKAKYRLPALHIAARKNDCKAADLLLQSEEKADVLSKSGFTPLHVAAHHGHEEMARLLLKRGADVNHLAKNNISPLHVAAKWGQLKLVKLFLEHSAHVDPKTIDGLTPLHCASRSGHEQVVATLLEYSAPISARSKNGLAPLHMATQGDHMDAVRVLLYHRAPVDELTIDYLTPLHVASHCGHVRVAKLLLDRKADPNARALNGFTPLHIACKKNHIKIVELLLKHGASIETTTESGLTPLHVASFMGCMNIVIFLLQHEANPDVPTVRGETPLHLAARANQTDIIRILLRNGAKVDARAREEQTPLHIAARLGNIDIVMLLLQHGAAVDATTKDMYTALHIAAKQGQEEVAAILLDNNASVKATTKNGFTPLHIAAKYGNMNVAKILLQKDSKLDARGKNDISALHLACHYDHPNVANFLLEKGASPHLASLNGHTPLHIAARKNQMDIASTLLEGGANVNAESKAGFTPLHLSAQKGHYDMTNLLIEHGADPNRKARNGLTALHLCAQEDFIRVASILVKNGGNVESETETGYRPIHVAAHFGNLSMIRFLLKHNAEIDVRTNQMYTPLHQAAQQGHANVVTALLEGNASHKVRTNDGLTALNIAQKLGYISVIEVLKGLSYDSVTPDNKNWEEKYKVIAPESLQETSFMSDSDDEGGSDTLISEQPYQHLTADLMKSLRDDSLPIDVTRDDPVHRPVSKEEKQEFVQSGNYCIGENFDGTDILHFGKLHFRSFLVSFLVDARGGAMKGCRHSGVRIIVPPQRAAMPIRVTCRLVKPNKLANPPPLMDGEALATRIIEMGPVGATFLGPVLVDIPHFASTRGNQREIIILRSENGESWKEHENPIDNDDSLMNIPHDSQMNATHSGRITRIITSDFPLYFAIISRIKQEIHVIGAEGGILTSSVAEHIQAVFPPGALTKKIKVGLQAHIIPPELTAKILGNCAAVSPVITIEPRRRKFHKGITLTLPAPQAANKGMINQYGGETPTLRLLCSIISGTSETLWEDVTGSTPLTFIGENRVSFSTNVSARFWLMDCRNIEGIAKMAAELYKQSLFVPYITNFVIYSKRLDVLEATLRILCMTDSKEGMHTLERQEEFLEIVKSRDVEALDGKDLYIEFSGNLVPVTKSGIQLKFTFRAFRQNRLSFHVKVKDPTLDPVARMMFMREPKVPKGEPPQQPICVLNIVLPEVRKTEPSQKKGHEDFNIISQKMDQYATKYKETSERKEKSDEPKDSSPTEKKLITDTLQKEQTGAVTDFFSPIRSVEDSSTFLEDAATIHESLAQKAACPLESVDASYPNKVGDEDLSLELEKQTYSEKRKFWEDISRKRESYQRSESEVSRASQLTINESDSECVQNVVSEEDFTEPTSLKSETLEDSNVPDISECSVAEKAHYFEEQIQKEMAKLPPKLQQQDSLKDRDRTPRSSKTDEQNRLAIESAGRSSFDVRKETLEEKHVTESRETVKEPVKSKIPQKKHWYGMKEGKDQVEEKDRDESKPEGEVEPPEEPVKLEEAIKNVDISIKKEKEVVEPPVEKVEITKMTEKVTEQKEKKTVSIPVEEKAEKTVLEEVREMKQPEATSTEGVRTQEEQIAVKERPGNRVIKEETTIIYKVQEDGSLVQEQILKSVEIQGSQGQTQVIQESSLPGEVFEKSIPCPAYDAGFYRKQVIEDPTQMQPESKIESISMDTDVMKKVEGFAQEEQRGLEKVSKDVGAEPERPSISIKEDEERKKGEEKESQIKTVKKEFESRIPISTAKQDKEKSQKDTKVKVIEKLDIQETPEKMDTVSPTKKKEFESRIPKRIVDTSTAKFADKDIKKDFHVKKETETYSVTEKRSSEEITSKREERVTTKTSEAQISGKTFTDPREAFKIFEEAGDVKDEFTTITSKVDHKASSKVKQTEVSSSEISSGAEKKITQEEKERVKRKTSSESKLTTETPVEVSEETKSKSEELEKIGIQKTSMSISPGKEIVDASASKSISESTKEQLSKTFEDMTGVATEESGSSRIRESDADVAIRIRKDIPEELKDQEELENEKTRKDSASTAEGLGKIEKFVHGESYKESTKSFDTKQFVPSGKYKNTSPVSETATDSKDSPETVGMSKTETLEDKQKRAAKEIEVRNIAESLIQSIENEIEKRSAEQKDFDIKAKKEYLERIIAETVETAEPDHEKLADDLTRQFENIMKKSLEKSEEKDKTKPMESAKQRISIHEEAFEVGSARDSISISEDITKDEESSLQEREESIAFSSSQTRLQERDITMSPSSLSEQIELEEAMDMEIEGARQSEKYLSTIPSTLDISSERKYDFAGQKMISELSGARVLEILEPTDTHSRQDSVDVPSLEMDAPERKYSEDFSAKDPASLHKSAAVDSLEKIYQERDITVSPSTVSEDTNVDSSLILEQAVSGGSRKDSGLSIKRVDSFEIVSPPLVSPRLKVQGLEIKPVTWMIGDEKIEISEILEPSQAFDRELEEYQLAMRQQEQERQMEEAEKKPEFSKEEISRDVTTTKISKFTVIPVSEQDHEKELIENKLDITCQELIDTLQREYDAKTPTGEYVESIRRASMMQEDVEAFDTEDEQLSSATQTVEETKATAVTEEPVVIEEPVEISVPIEKEEAKTELASEAEAEIPSKESSKEKPVFSAGESEETKEIEEKKVELDKATTEKDMPKPTRVDEVLKDWSEVYVTKVKPPTAEEFKRHAEKTLEKPTRAAAIPPETCAFKLKKEEPPSVDLSARYAITVLDQVVKKEIAEVKENLEAAKQDLIEELSENSETMIQIKDSPSEFQFKLQPESIPNELPFLYKEPSLEQEPVDQEAMASKETEKQEEKEILEGQVQVETKVDVIPDVLVSEGQASLQSLPETVISSEKSESEAAFTAEEEKTDDGADSRDESASLAPPPVVPRKRHKPSKPSRKVLSESEGELGSSSGESSNYQSCEYEIGSGSRPSSSDAEALQSAAGIQSGTASEYETALMSIERSGSRATSQEYQTAASTLSSRESIKSLNSLSSGHLGSIDSTSELSETLVPSEAEEDKEEEPDAECEIEEEAAEQTDSSGSDIPIDEPVNKIDSHIPCRMKRSSEMIFQQIVDDGATLEPEVIDTSVESRTVDSATSAFVVASGPLHSVDIMTSRVTEDGVQSVCTQVISTQQTVTTTTTTTSTDAFVDDVIKKMEVEEEPVKPVKEEKIVEQVTESEAEAKDMEAAEEETEEESQMQEGDSTVVRASAIGIASRAAMLQQGSMSTSSASGVSMDTVIERDKSGERHSPDSDSFELIDKPDIMDDFVVIEEVGREAEEYDSEGKSIKISAASQVPSKHYDRDLENLITEKEKEAVEVSTSQPSRNNELFDFESEESPPQASNDDQYSQQSYSDDEQYDAGAKKWIEMQFQADARVYDIEYDRGPLEDIKEEEVTDFEAGSSRFGSLGSHKESIGSVGSMRGSFGSTPDYDVLTGKKYFTKPSDHDNVSLSSLQEFEHLESAVAAENSRRLQCGSQDSVNNGSLPRRYMTSRSGHGDDVSLSSLKDFEGLEKACREAHLIELRAREEEDLLEHESPENRYKLECLARAKASASAASSVNISTSGSDDYEKRIKEIDEIIRIAQANVEKLDRQDDTTEDVSQIEVTDLEKGDIQTLEQVTASAILPAATIEEDVEEQPKDSTNIMETSTDSLEMEENADKRHNPLCRSSDSLEMKTTLDFPSLSSDSLNNVKDAKEATGEQFASSARRISSDSLEMPLPEQQEDPETGAETGVQESSEQTSEADGRASSDQKAKDERTKSFSSPGT